MKILLVQTAFIGDCILATPVIDAIKALYQDASLTVLTTPQSKDIFIYHPKIKEVLVFDKRKSQKGLRGIFNIATLLKEKQFDLAFCLHKSWRTAIMLWLTRIPIRYGFKEAAASFLYTSRARREDLKHEVLRNLAILRNLNLEPTGTEGRITVETGEEANQEANQIGISSKDKKLICLAPGSVWATKRWTVKGFSKVAEVLLNKGFKVVLVGAPEDKEIAEEIISRSKGVILNAVGRTSLLGTAKIIERSAVLITNDSAPLHLASAKKTPVVALFCATIPEFGFGPWDVEHRIIEVKGLKCRPCGRHGHQYCPTDTHDCQLLINPETVISAVEELINNVVI